MTSIRKTFRFTLFTIVIALSGTVYAADAHEAQLSSETCASLRGFAIPASAIGLPSSGATVQTATMISTSEEGNGNGNFCKVIGIVKPHNPDLAEHRIRGQPSRDWNRRAVQMGGGGYDGSLVTGLTQYANQTPNTDTPLKQGYVTLGSDGGHKGKPGFDGIVRDRR